MAIIARSRTRSISSSSLTIDWSPFGQEVTAVRGQVLLCVGQIDLPDRVAHDGRPGAKLWHVRHTLYRMVSDRLLLVANWGLRMPTRVGSSSLPPFEPVVCRPPGGAELPSTPVSRVKDLKGEPVERD